MTGWRTSFLGIKLCTFSFCAGGPTPTGRQYAKAKARCVCLLCATRGMGDGWLVGGGGIKLIAAQRNYISFDSSLTTGKEKKNLLSKAASWSR